MSSKELEIALSPCPNDVFIVSGLLLKEVETPIKFNFYFEDIETLNNLAIDEKYPVIKTSFALWKKIYQSYQLLPVGSALGFGVGPLLVGIKNFSVNDFPSLKIAIPGEHTTAHLLFNFFYQGKIEKVFIRYDKIIPALLENKVQLGILIHEGRFVYRSYNLIKVVDLGAYWEEKTQAPVPLGGFFIKKELPEEIKSLVVQAFRKSLNWAKNNWEKVFPLLKHYAQELEKTVIKQHVETYVNEYTYDLKDVALKGLDSLKKFLKISEPLEKLIWRD